jgi:cysteinyl-tRNA synthetase
MTGVKVKHVMNITDCDDRTIQAAEREGLSLSELTENIRLGFMADLKTLGVKAAEEYPRASAYVEQMVDLAAKLVKDGFAYEKLKSVYFNIAKFASYGKLSGVDLNKIHLGATVDLDRYEKEDPRDFTLLKRSTLAEIKRGVSHRTEWGNIRPGWHIECATMAMSLLGEQADIHVGGIDLIFPHHENEIAICQALTGKRPANYWIHSGLVMVEGRKMSRSAGNSVSIRDLLERGYTSRQIRFFLISQHYRQPLHFSYPALDATCGSLKRLDACVRKLRALSAGPAHDDVQRLLSEFDTGFKEALYDDLNVSAAVAALFHLVRRINRRLALGQVGAPDAEKILQALQRSDAVMGILLETEDTVQDEQVEVMIREREGARQAQDYETADRLRQAIEARGFILEDTPEGPHWRKR